MCSKIENGLTFNWKIKNFSFYCQRKELSLRSQVFSGKTLNKTNWCLYLYPRFLVGFENYLAYKLVRYEGNKKELFNIDYTIEILGENGVNLKSLSIKNESCESRQHPLYIIKTNDLISTFSNWSCDTLIVRCSMNKSKEKKISGCDVLSSTIYYICQLIVLKVDSNFSCSKEICYKFLFFSIKLILSSIDDSIRISVVTNEITSSVMTKLRIFLLDVNGDECDSVEEELWLEATSETSNWDFPNFLTKSRLRSTQPAFLENGKFKLRCTFMTLPMIGSKNLKEYIENITPAQESISKVGSLQGDLTAMFRDKKHSDVKLRIDNQFFCAHKTVLSARSPVFSAMFDQDMLEARTGIIDIKDVDAAILKKFLEFLYSDSLSVNDSDETLDLLRVADKYQVQSLIEKCSLFLSTHLSSENVCEILLAADMTGHKLLKTTSMDYIKTHASKILKLPEWSEWTEKNIKLATEVFAELADYF